VIYSLIADVYLSFKCASATTMVSRLYSRKGITHIWGVPMKLSRPSRPSQVSTQAGSILNTSLAAAFIVDFVFSASHKACSSTTAPLDMLTSIEPGFIISNSRVEIRFRDSSVSGQCSVRISTTGNIEARLSCRVCGIGAAV
jgi:hypothetical protein